MGKSKIEDVRLKGTKIRLRAVTEKDVPRLIKWDEDEEISKWAGKKFACRAEAQNWYVKNPPANKRTFVVETVDGELIGEIEIVNISWRLHTGELRVIIGEKEYWDQGIGTDAVLTFARWIFERYSINTIYLRVDKQNYRARRCYSKAGFKAVGRLEFSESRGVSGRGESTQLILMKVSKHELNTGLLK